MYDELRVHDNVVLMLWEIIAQEMYFNYVKGQTTKLISAVCKSLS